MDEDSQNSFYEDDLQVGGATTDVIRHLKDEGHLAFKTNCQQLIEGTPESIGHEQRANDSSGFTVPVCDEQICPSELPQDIADHTTTSMSNSPPQDQRTVPSAGLGAEMHVISDSFTDLKEDPQEHPAKYANCLPLPVTCLKDSYGCNKDDAGKQSGASQPVWPAVGVKSLVTEIKITHQSILSFFTMVEEAHLLTEEQIEQIKRQVHNEHSDQCSRILKRSSPFQETCGVHVEKFAKMDFDDDIENSIEDREFFSQEKTNDDCSVGPRINLDQEVPIQNEDDNSKGKVPGIADGQFPGNTSSTVSSFSEGTFLNSKSNSLTWQSSIEDHFLFTKNQTSPFYEEPNIVESCTESLCLKFSKQNCCPRANENSSKEEVLSGCVEAKVSITNPELRCGEPCLTADKPAGSSEPFEKEHVLIMTNEDSTHDLLHKEPNRSHEIHHHIACQYPPSAQRAFNDTDMCSCLRAIGEKDLITDSCLAGMDFSPLQSRRDLLKGEISLPHERQEFLDWGNCDMLWHSRKFKGLERFTTSIPDKSINHASLWHAECFDKVRMNVFLDNSFYDQPVSLTKGALNPTVKVCEGDPEKLSLTGVAVDSRNAGHLQGICDQTTKENMETEEVADHGEMEIMANFQGQENHNQIKTAQVTDDKQVLNVTKKDDFYPLMESNADENMKEFNYGQQENDPLGESSETKDEKEISYSNSLESDQFGSEIERRMMDLDGPELLQFAMILVQGALEKSQIVPSCNEGLKYDKGSKNMSQTAPAFSWKNKILYHSQQAPALGPTENDKPSNEQGGSNVHENGDHMEGDNKEGTPFYVRPLPKTSSNRPLRLGLSRKHRNKSLHPYLKKHSE